jgi:hypothetical protein
MAKSKIKVSLSGTEMTSESKGKGSKKSPRQIFYSELMKRLAGDPGVEVAEAFVGDRKKFKSLMIGIIGKMADTETD